MTVLKDQAITPLARVDEVSDERRAAWLLVHLACVVVLAAIASFAGRLVDHHQGAAGHAVLAVFAVGMFLWMRLVGFYPVFTLRKQRSSGDAHWRSKS